MTYTINQLQQMSDFEVNKALCIKLGYDVSGISEQRNMMTDAVTNYCNNPADIMPLAFERKIGVAPLMRTDGKTWLASFSDKLRFEDANPLRAIACLLLMIED